MDTTTHQTTTANGMTALSNTGSELVDLFFKISSARDYDIIPEFKAAYDIDPIIASKIALWARDVREGAGEREVFRKILRHLESIDSEMLERIIPRILELGRADDLLVFTTKKYQAIAFGIIKQELDAGNKLVGKWLPREKSSRKSIASSLRSYLKLSAKSYRKLLVRNTNVVETQMCNKEWDSIEFGKIPSLASARYQQAFTKNAPITYELYKAGLKLGTEKINASAVYPYDVIKSLRFGDQTVADAQWNALPNYMGGSNILPLVDVSGSMASSVGGSENLSCLDVAISLGLYCSERNSGMFKDHFITFSKSPSLEILSGSLYERFRSLASSAWGMNTDIKKAFELILDIAVSKQIPQSEMPEILLILSDMDFDEADKFTAYELVNKNYSDAGYTMPKIVFWNLHSTKHVPVSMDENNTALVSGFSPAIMKSILSAEEFTPQTIMFNVISNTRYNLDV